MLSPKEQEAYRKGVVAFKEELAREAASIDELEEIAQRHFAGLIAELEGIPEDKRDELLALGARIAITEAVIGHQKTMRNRGTLELLLEAS